MLYSEHRLMSWGEEGRGTARHQLAMVGNTTTTTKKTNSALVVPPRGAGQGASPQSVFLKKSHYCSEPFFQPRASPPSCQPDLILLLRGTNDAALYFSK